MLGRDDFFFSFFFFFFFTFFSFWYPTGRSRETGKKRKKVSVYAQLRVTSMNETKRNATKGQEKEGNVRKRRDTHCRRHAVSHSRCLTDLSLHRIRTFLRRVTLPFFFLPLYKRVSMYATHLACMHACHVFTFASLRSIRWSNEMALWNLNARIEISVNRRERRGAKMRYDARVQREKKKRTRGNDAKIETDTRVSRSKQRANWTNRFKTFFCYSGATTNDEQVKPRSLRFTWSMKTTSSRDPNEIMSEIRKVLHWIVHL